MELTLQKFKKKTQMAKLIIIFILILISSANSQTSNPMDLKRWNKMDINKVATVFNNAGMSVMEIIRTQILRGRLLSNIRREVQKNMEPV